MICIPSVEHIPCVVVRAPASRARDGILNASLRHLDGEGGWSPTTTKHRAHSTPPALLERHGLGRLVRHQLALAGAQWSSPAQVRGQRLDQPAHGSIGRSAGVESVKGQQPSFALTCLASLGQRVAASMPFACCTAAASGGSSRSVCTVIPLAKLACQLRPRPRAGMAPENGRRVTPMLPAKKPQSQDSDTNAQFDRAFLAKAMCCIITSRVLSQSPTARPQRQLEVGKRNQRMMTMAARKQVADQ